MTENMTIGVRMNALAAELAAIKSPHMDDAVSFIIKAKDDYQGGPVKIMAAIAADYADTIDRFPVMGSTGGNNPAIYKVKSEGKSGKMKDEDWYNVFADKRPASVTVIQQMDWARRLNDPNMKDDGIPAEFIKEYNTSDKRNLLIQKLTSKKGNLRIAVKGGFKLYYQLTAVNELAHLKAFIVPGKEAGTFENLVQVRSTIEGEELTEADVYSLTTFMKLDAARAAENGGTYAALDATKKRDKKPDGTVSGAASNPQLIATIDTFKARINDIHSFMDKVWNDKDQTHYLEILKTVGPKGPAGSDDFTLSLYQLDKMLKDIFNEEHPEILKRAEALAEADAVSAPVKAAA